MHTYQVPINLSELGQNCIRVQNPSDLLADSKPTWQPVL